MPNDTMIYYGSELKAQGGGAIEGYLVRWGNPEELDLAGDFFTPETYLGAHDGDGVDVTVQHGYPLRYFDNPEQMAMAEKYAAQLLAPVKTARDDIGLLAETILDLNDEYQAMLYEMVESGRLSWSSGSAPHLVKRTEMPGGASRIDRWIIAEAALTPTPAEPRLGAVHTMKSLMNVSASEQAPDGVPDVGNDGRPVVTMSAADDDDVKNVKPISRSEVVMTNAETPQAVTSVIDYEKLAAMIVAATPPPVAKSAGVVVNDELDAKAENPALRPYATIGEFLQDVAKAATNPPPPRLLRSHKFSAKASGMSETIPSDGGFLVQTDFVNDLVTPIYDDGIVMQRLTDRLRTSQRANSVEIPVIRETTRENGVILGGVRAYRRSELGEAATASQPTIGLLNLKLSPMDVVMYATQDLIADTALLNSIVSKVPEAFIVKTEGEIFNGTGVGELTGIIGAPGTVSVAKEKGQSAATITPKNILDMWSRAIPGPADYAWFCTRQVAAHLQTMNLTVGTGGSLVYMPPGGLSGSPFATLQGDPVVIVPYTARLGTEGDLVYGSMSKYRYTDKANVLAAQSIHVHFLTQKMTYLWTMRNDGQPMNISPVIPYNGGDTMGHFLTIATRA